MRPLQLFVTLIPLMLVSTAASAQPPVDTLTPLQISIACAPPPALASPPSNALRIVGSQDTVARAMYNERDLLVVNGGMARGIQIGQRFFVRRLVPLRGRYLASGRREAHTAGWVRVVAVTDATSTVAVEQACGEILAGDYMEPFQAPAVRGNEQIAAIGDLNFSSAGRILYGDEERTQGAIGEYMLIDRGSEQGVSAGARFAIYRDVRRSPGARLAMYAVRPRPTIPLASVGEASVVSVGPTMAVVRINQARDAVVRGDIVVPRR